MRKKSKNAIVIILFLSVVVIYNGFKRGDFKVSSSNKLSSKLKVINTKFYS